MPTDVPKSTPICTEMRGSCDGATDYASVLAGPPPVTPPSPALDASGSESELAPRYRQPYLGGQQPRRKTAASDPGKGRTGGPGKVCQQGIDHSPTTLEMIEGLKIVEEEAEDKGSPQSDGSPQ